MRNSRDRRFNKVQAARSHGDELKEAQGGVEGAGAHPDDNTNDKLGLLRAEMDEVLDRLDKVEKKSSRKKDDDEG